MKGNLKSKLFSSRKASSGSVFLRHCEERSDAAIHVLKTLYSINYVKELEMHGLPRRFAPRNDNMQDDYFFNTLNK